MHNFYIVLLHLVSQSEAFLISQVFVFQKPKQYPRDGKHYSFELVE